MTPPYTLRRPLAALPYKPRQGEAEGSFPLRVRPMRMADAQYWDRHVQPLIRAQYDRWHGGDETPSGGPSEKDTAPVRADVKWSWRDIFVGTKLYNFTKSAALPGQRALAWCLEIDVAAQPSKVLIGMLTAVPLYGSPVKGDATKRGFAWYLSNAPVEYYDKLGVERVPSVAKALIDTAIQLRLKFSDDASIFLHADAAGGPRLVEYYGKYCSMTRVLDPKAMVSPLRWTLGGDYFIFEHDQATAFCQQYDTLRSPQEHSK